LIAGGASAAALMLMFLPDDDAADTPVRARAMLRAGSSC